MVHASLNLSARVDKSSIYFCEKHIYIYIVNFIEFFWDVFLNNFRKFLLSLISTRNLFPDSFIIIFFLLSSTRVDNELL